MGDREWSAFVSLLPQEDFHTSRNDLPRQPFALDHMVPRNVACLRPEERGKCIRVATCPWTWQLQDGLDVPAQIEKGNGSAQPRQIVRID